MSGRSSFEHSWLQARRWTSRLAALAAVAATWLAVACDDAPDGDGDADADTDVDADTDADVDADTDVDSDADAGGDASLDADAGADSGGDAPPTRVRGTLRVDLTFPTVERSRAVYVWVVDADGAYVDTVQQYFGRTETYPDGEYGATGIRYENDQCHDWQAAVGESSPGPLVMDGVTTASALAGASGEYSTVVWDCRDVDDRRVLPGTYTILVEMSIDALGHPMNPVHHYSAEIELGATSTTAALGPTDGAMTSGTVRFTAR